MGSLIYLFTELYNMFLTAVRHEVNNLESSVVVQELELWSLGNQYNIGTLSRFSLALTTKCRAV